MRREPRRQGRGRPGFTLIELMVVLLIIGIVMSLILVASMGAVREAEHRATQALIHKLENGLNDRIEAILTQRIDPLTAHGDMAMIYAGGFPIYTIPPRILPNPPPLGWVSDYSKVAARAQTVALFDLYKAELPDVFFVQKPQPSAGNNPPDYPINFGSQQVLTLNGGYYNYLLPLGVGSQPSTGIFGASYTVMGGLLKNLGNIVPNPTPLDPRGYDGSDNNNNGWVDEYDEGVMSGANPNVSASLTNHRHKTARSEMLYALLVNSTGPYGSVFSPDDFTEKEVRDTDNDGLPEFVDAWGEPLYFYRWPIFYHSDLQKGVDPQVLINIANGTGQTGPYAGVFESRELDPLDPNQYLTAAAWWSSSSNAGTASTMPLSLQAYNFQLFFHLLVEPLSAPPKGTSNPNFFWDRGTTLFQRRAYFSRFLIASSGPDKTLGLPRVYSVIVKNGKVISGEPPPVNPPGSRVDIAIELDKGTPPPTVSIGTENSTGQYTRITTNPDIISQVIAAEGQAGSYDLVQRVSSPTFALYGGTLVTPSINPQTGNTLNDDAQDDITNHSLQTSGGSTQ